LIVLEPSASSIKKVANVIIFKNLKLQNSVMLKSMLFPFAFAYAVIMIKKKQHFIKDMLFFCFMNILGKNNIQILKQ